MTRMWMLSVCCMLHAVYIIKPPNLQVDLVPTLPTFLIAVGPCPLNFECVIPQKEKYAVEQIRSLNIKIPENILKGRFIRILEKKEFVVYVYEYEKQAACGKTKSDVHDIIPQAEVVVNWLDYNALLSMDFLAKENIAGRYLFPIVILF